MLKVLFVLVWFLFHPVHVSLTSIDYIPEIDSINLFVRVYFDDFLLDSRLDGQVIDDVDFSNEDDESKAAIEEYIGDRIKITIDNMLLSGSLKDLDLVDNELNVNVLYPVLKKPENITVKLLIMTQLYEDMSNMLIVRVGDFEEGVKLTSDINEKIFKIK